MKRPLGKNSTELQHILSEINANSQTGEIFRACYRYGRASHSDTLRDAKKILFYAQAEVKRLEIDAMSPVPEGHADKNGPDYTDGEWRGGECPVPGDVVVQYVTRGGYQMLGRAKYLEWSHRNGRYDIIHFRVVK